MFQKYGLYLIIALSIIGGGYTIHRMAVKSAVAQAEANLNAQYQNKLSEQKDKAIAKERQLQQESLILTKKKDEKIKSISSKLNITLNELQQRTSRSSSNTSSTTPSSGKTCTGAELYREDGEFLAREAARADKILEERDYYYSEYERASSIVQR